jgi:hypothetical protein
MSAGARQHIPTIVISVVIAILFASTAPWWWTYMPWVHANPAAAVSPLGFSGGCAPFELYAQNRWQPYGTAIRAAPSPTSKETGAFSPNHLVAVNGWVYGVVAYPTNVPPFNNNIWYHLADNSGWVSFAGVRAVPTAEDPSGLASGGPSGPISAACQGATQ